MTSKNPIKTEQARLEISEWQRANDLNAVRMMGSVKPKPVALKEVCTTLN